MKEKKKDTNEIVETKEKKKFSKGKKALIIIVVIIYTVVVSLASSMLTKAIIDYKENKITLEKQAEEESRKKEKEKSEASNSVSIIAKGDKDENSVEDDVNDVELPDFDTKDPDRIVLAFDQDFASGDILEMKLTSCEWAEEILPSNTSDYYNYYDDEEGEKYFVIKGEIKNIAPKQINVGDVSNIKMFVNGRYESSSVYVTCEETDGSGFDAYIKPLQTQNVIIYASFSDEVYDIYEDVRVEMDFIKNSEDIGSSIYYMDDIETSKYVINLEK